MGLKLPNKKGIFGKPDISADKLKNGVLLEPATQMVLDAYHNAGYYGGGFEDAHFEFDTNSGKTAAVLKAPEYSRFMLYGRGPGKMPPIEPIAGWCAKYGIAISPWAVAMHIAKAGTKGNDFLTPVLPEAIGYINAQIAKLIEEELLFEKE